MVLAAGKGTRLRPLTDVVPKPLCEVAGVPLIRLALRQLCAAGVSRAVINLHHLGGRIREHLGVRAEGVDLAFSEEPVILGTGGGIRAALPLLGDGPFFVVNADALQDVDLKALAHTHFQHRALATLCLRPDPQAARYGIIGVDDAGVITRMIDQFDGGRSTRLLMFTGVHIMDGSVVADLVPGQEACVIRQGYIPALRSGAHLHAHVHHGVFHDVGTPERWAQAQGEVMGRQESALWAVVTEAAGNGAGGFRTPAPGVWVHAGAFCDPGARLVGPVVVHADARVESNAVVGPWTAVGPGARVQSGATVQRAAVLGGVDVPRGATVCETVVGPQVRLPWSWPPAPCICSAS